MIMGHPTTARRSMRVYLGGGGGIPDADALVEASGGYIAAARRELHRVDRAGVALEVVAVREQPAVQGAGPPARACVPQQPT